MALMASGQVLRSGFLLINSVAIDAATGVAQLVPPKLRPNSACRLPGAESEAALREVSVISAEAFLKQAENVLKDLVSAVTKRLVLSMQVREPFTESGNYYKEYSATAASTVLSDIIACTDDKLAQGYIDSAVSSTTVSFRVQQAMCIDTLKLLSYASGFEHRVNPEGTVDYMASIAANLEGKRVFSDNTLSFFNYRKDGFRVYNKLLGIGSENSSYQPRSPYVKSDNDSKAKYGGFWRARYVFAGYLDDDTTLEQYIDNLITDTREAPETVLCQGYDPHPPNSYRKGDWVTVDASAVDSTGKTVPISGGYRVINIERWYKESQNEYSKFMLAKVAHGWNIDEYLRGSITGSQMEQPLTGETSGTTTSGQYSRGTAPGTPYSGTPWW